MHRFVMVLCVLFSIGCSPAAESEVANGESDREVVEGGTVENVDRDKAQDYLTALGKVQSVEEEEKLLTDFAEWLKMNGYKIKVEEAEGKHLLSCPYFPPITPWTSHSFLDVKNLELLPQ